MCKLTSLGLCLLYFLAHCLKVLLLSVMRERENLMIVRSSPGTEVLRGVSNWHVKVGESFVLVGFLVGIEHFSIEHEDGLN